MRYSLRNPVDSEPKRVGYTCTSNVSTPSFTEGQRLAYQIPMRPALTSVSSVRQQEKLSGAFPTNQTMSSSTASQSPGTNSPLNPAPHRLLEFFLSKKNQHLTTQDIRYPPRYRKYSFLILPHFFGHPEFTEIFPKQQSRLRINRRESRNESNYRKKYPLEKHDQILAPVIAFRFGWE